LTQQEREKIIEVLISQERVLTLLYDKTFPPRPAAMSSNNTGAQGGNTIGINKSLRLLSAGGSMGDLDDMRQFNYYGQIPNQTGGGLGGPYNDPNEINEEDILKLEREIEDLLRNRVTSAAGPRPGTFGSNNNGIVNINDMMTGITRVTKSAHVAKRGGPSS